MGTGLPAVVADEAMAIAALAPAEVPWTVTAAPARHAASRLADLFTEDELVEGLRLLQRPTADATAGGLGAKAVVALELAIVLARSSLRAAGAGDGTLRLTS